MKLSGHFTTTSQLRTLFFQICLKLSFIVGQLPAVLPVLFSESLMPGTDIIKMNCRNIKVVAFISFSIDGSSIPLPENIISSSFERILLKSTEILIGMNISLPLGSLQIDIKRTIIHLISSYIRDTLLFHDGIILWTPSNQIFRICHSKLRRTAIDTPKCTPGTIICLHHKRTIHFLLAPPWAKITGA